MLDSFAPQEIHGDVKASTLWWDQDPVAYSASLISEFGVFPIHHWSSSFRNQLLIIPIFEKSICDHHLHPPPPHSSICSAESIPLYTMVEQDHGTPTGWPLGLGNLNLRLRVTESQQPAAAEAEAEPYSLHAHSSSFSSFSSSNLETESTASFFQDHSVSLGRLMGIKPRDRGYFPSTISSVEQHESTSARISFPDAPGNRVEELSRGVCVPLLVSILMKMTRSRSNSSR
ncbi:hypothetical protein RHMOL_Rhmol13G0239400 [Rhododendron molle]|uniref:Uncharacterized protein n=1 Tax=Rhododendron molle TaxID=49168 RepID=A0ACC0LAH1_RHOML|nr:hypothetical protein RHMOL_Rhmol13G0239400 [Rhododendron molle]